MPPKRKTANKPSTNSSKKPKTAVGAAASGKTPNSDDLPFNEWRVAMTGDIIGIAAFKETLKARGVTITGSISGKTTHLLLGKSGRNDYGHVSGIGSTKHKEAQERNLPILGQNQVMRLLAGQTMEEVTAQPKKPPKSATTYNKVLYCVAAANDEQKISLSKLKEALKTDFGIDCSKGASKSALKKALDKAMEEGKLQKDGGSYKIPLPVQVELKQPPPETLDAKIRRISPANGHWRGLRVLSSKPSKSGRAMCRSCEEIIEKGVVQVEVVDDSLFKMLTRKGGLYEGGENGYIECGFPGFETAASKKFFVHEACQEDADTFFRSKFEEDWARIRPYVEQCVRSDHNNSL